MPPIPQIDLRPAHAALAPEIEDALRELLADCDFIQGAAVRRFEVDWARFCRVEHAVAVANGTDALEIGLSALGIGPGDEVILPAMTYVASAEAVVNVGARPVFVDVRARDACIDPEAVAAAIGPRSAAILAVHLYGQPADLSALEPLAERHGLALIEDAAQAHGASRDGRRAGSVGAFAGFSFYPSKNLGAIGDAGALVTSDAALAERARSLRDHGRDAAGRHARVGRNSRMDGLQAAVLSIKLRHLEAWNRARIAHAAAYSEALADLPGLRIPQNAPSTCHVYHQYPLKVAPEAPCGGRTGLAEALAAEGIETRVHYPLAVHQTPAFARFAVPGGAPEAEAWAREELSLPMYPELPDSWRDRVIDRIRARVGLPAAAGGL